ncbi:MAG: DUF192 domain-containing protein [Candidatus Micrarchaeota archaeon]|nr:DUF192 domain-containing protein [Candidatus Micrarchaeota archaeon]
MLKFLYGLQRYTTRSIMINRSRYTAIIADSSIKRAIGLMFRQELGAKQCMLFTFNHSGRHSIWMHNMRFPIDAVWLDEDGAVVDIKERLKPCSSLLNCPQYAPARDAKYLIELNAGNARRERIRKGSKIVL